MILMAQVFTHGVMVVGMRVHGKRIRCMDRENLLGLTIVHTKEVIPLIRKKDMVFSLGQMVKDMKANGGMENKKEKDYITHLMAENDMGFG